MIGKQVRTTVPASDRAPLSTAGARDKALGRIAARAAAATDAMTRLIDAREAAELLGVPYTWLLAEARARRIPHHRLGRYVRFSPADLRDWLDATKIPAATGSKRA
jgi:excisionase family DNA binding protein